MIIPFRSRFHNQIKQWFSQNIKNHNWSEFVGISPYWVNSDSKNIFWKKSTREFAIFEKKFSDFSDFQIIFCNISENWDNFFNEKNPKSRKKWKKESIHQLQHSAEILNISHEILDFTNLDECISHLIKRQIYNKLIIILSNSEIENSLENIKKISSINELIWIKSYHPFEKNPNNTSLFLGKIFNTKFQKKYLQELENLEKSEKNFLWKLKIPLIITNTNIPINITLYNFFKYKYE